MFSHHQPSPCIVCLLASAGLWLSAPVFAQRDAGPGLGFAAERADDPDAAEQAGRCVRYLRERARLQQQRAQTLDPLMSRSRAIDSAMSVLSLPSARPAQARALRVEVRELDEQINALRDALAGQPSDSIRRKRVADIRTDVKALEQTRMRKSLLARSHAADGRARVALLDQLREEKQGLTDRIDQTTDPYDRRVRWLSDAVRRHDDAFKQAMHRFGRIAEVGGTSVQAVRVHTVISEGRLSFSWTDAQGSVVASAILRLTADPDPYHQPPFVLERYPVLLQGRQETQILAGHFHIEFRVGVDALSGEDRVLDTATKLLDIDALGRLIPRLGSGGLD
ncbi:MAG: hypothetical protein ACE37H_15985 [Phycisphaeraceae bacterium]